MFKMRPDSEGSAYGHPANPATV